MPLKTTKHRQCADATGTRLNKIKLHFPGLRPSTDPIDLVKALRVGGYDPIVLPPGPERHRYDDLNQHAVDYFEPAEAAAADVWVFPYRAADHLDEVRRLSAEARKQNIGFMCLSWSDVDDVIDLPHGTAYRHSMFADRKLPCEAAMPAFVSDIAVETGKPIEPRVKADRPEVGFCGFVGSSLQRAFFRFTGRARKAVGPALRAKALEALRNPKIDAKIISRNAYWAGTVGRFHHNASAQFTPREEFIGNLLGTTYTLCVRGAGNFSYRFYEVLSAGRIPLLVNTRCVLPFDDQIDWRQHCVWVEEADLAKLGDRLIEFHSSRSAEEFADLQRANRKLWETHLSPLAFYRQSLGRAARQRAQV